MKKLTSMLLAVLMGCMFSVSAFAQESIDISGYDNEVVVEVESEEEILHYPKIPNVKYTFIIQNPSATRAVCHQCGKWTLGLATVRTEWSRAGKSCPMNEFGPIDHFMTDKNYQVERCTACGYQLKLKNLPNTYRSLCRNTDLPDDQEYEVRREWREEDGYDLHQVYDYWVNRAKQFMLNS